MFNKSTQMLFMGILITSILLSISSNSWFVVWMGMEINMMSFMPMIMEQKNMMSKESSLTYFMVQTIASMLLIMSVIMLNIKKLNFTTINPMEMMLMSALMMKSGMSPFHFWMPKMMEGMNWNNCFILMTMQKIIPLMMMSNIIKINMLTMTAMMMSIFIGAIGGLNQTSLRKLMAYSSISNNGWMMAAMMISETTWVTYMLFYMMMTMIMTTTMNMYKNYHINQLISMNETTTKKFLLMMNMISISGLPPMMGFMPKWIVIQSTTNMNQLMLMGVMIMLTLITIYYYLRVMFTTMTLVNIEPKWNNNNSNKNYKMTTMMSVMSITSLTLITMMMTAN
uniref:NADH dehydrogenase subunit 2 n=1 Tax=Sungaya inexpectata TaxID=202437 RepID=UPI0025A95B49|nr:NADH dehydrogenase subunit 2 [Sungaya inexpectata]WID87016.1 NADH dehydrogenase subunit 2 [Sungaya inexpectata]